MTQATATARVPLAAAAPGLPLARQLCPYCGHLQSGAEECEQCKGLFEPLSRQATQNSMGPWQLRDAAKPFAPGFSYDVLKMMVARGRITSASIIRGPTTNQFWSFAIDVPGVAALLGRCHSCRGSVSAEEYMCRACGAVLTPATDRQSLGLAPVVPVIPGAVSVPAGVAGGAPGVSANWSASATPLPMVTTVNRAGGGAAASAAVSATTRATPMSVAQALDIPADAIGAAAPAGSLASARALRRQNAQLRGLLLVAAAACALLGTGLLYIALISRSTSTTPTAGSTTAKSATANEHAQNATKPADSPAGVAGDAAAAAPTPATSSTDGAPVTIEATPGAPIGEVPGLDAGLSAWSDSIDDAAKLAEKDTKESLRTAIAKLEEVRTAAATAAGRKPDEFPLLSARIEAYKARLDKLLLRDLF